jgi:RimJ/RimL family protein N-acetyltransferase
MLETERLILRQWREDDFPLFGTLNSDPRVQQSFYHKSDVEASVAMARRLEDRITRYGYGLWAVEFKETSTFVGFTGLAKVMAEIPAAPCTEIAWRIAPEHWGKGIATEAARAALADGFTRVGLDEIVSYTLPSNAASRRIMDKIGMTYDPADDFDHPEIPEGHPMRRMVLYRAKR